MGKFKSTQYLSKYSIAFEIDENEKAKVLSAPDNLDLVGKDIVHVDENYYRPTEVELLIGDPSKANKELGWKPKYDLDALIAEMIEYDLELFKKDELLKTAGFKVPNQPEE